MHFFLYTIIFLEGYVVLATELLAIRQLIPFVGSGTETIAIIIAAVLMPLAFGYYAGGRYKVKLKRKELVTIRKKLIHNVLAAAIILGIGLSYVFLELFFKLLMAAGVAHRVPQAAIYSMLFLVYPVYLLGQTVPLISNYFRKSNLSKTTGRILSCSTVGSFTGATLSTLVLMGTLGVHNVIIINVLLLCVVVWILDKRWLTFNNGFMIFVLLLTFGLNGDAIMHKLHVVEDNNYNMVGVFDGDEKDTKILYINRSVSAKYAEDPALRLEYLKFLEANILKPMIDHPGAKPKSLLVIGAGGFTFGQDDTFNQYTYVDIDPSLKNVAEEHFFKKELSQNKTFVPISGRAFFRQDHAKYDVIFLDAFTNVHSTPADLITKEFFQQVKEHLNPEGILLFNVITTANFSDRFSVKLDNTLREVFGVIHRQVVGDFNAWQQGGDKNIMYLYYHHDYSADNYTDNINTYFLDR